MAWSFTVNARTTSSVAGLDTVSYTVTDDSGVAVKTATIDVPSCMDADGLHATIRHQAWMMKYPPAQSSVTVGTAVTL